MRDTFSPDALSRAHLALVAVAGELRYQGRTEAADALLVADRLVLDTIARQTFAPSSRSPLLERIPTAAAGGRVR